MKTTEKDFQFNCFKKALGWSVDCRTIDLKEVIDSFSQLKGILPLKIDSLLASKLSLTFLVFDLNAIKVVCQEVKILLEFKSTQS